jgi:hypothetical protein
MALTIRVQASSPPAEAPIARTLWTAWAVASNLSGRMSALSAMVWPLEFLNEFNGKGYFALI